MEDLVNLLRTVYGTDILNAGCAGCIVIQNNNGGILQLDKTRFNCVTKWGLWDGVSEKFINMIAITSKFRPTMRYVIMKTDGITDKQLVHVKKLPIDNTIIYIIPSCSSTCVLPTNVRLLYMFVEMPYIIEIPLITYEPWTINKIVWRGQPNYDPNYNIDYRSRLVELLKDDPRCDAKITMGRGNPDHKTDPDRISVKDQCKYRAIIHMDATGPPASTTWALTSSRVSIIRSSMVQGFQRDLVPWVHYIPLADDLSNLRYVIKWVFENEEKCNEIVKNARSFLSTHLTKKSLLSKLVDETLAPCQSPHALDLQSTD
jgi:hypothetical protein